MGDEEQELLVEDGEGDDVEEGGAIDKGVLVQLSRRDSGTVISQRPARRARVRCRLLNEGLGACYCHKLIKVHVVIDKQHCPSNLKKWRE